MKTNSVIAQPTPKQPKIDRKRYDVRKYKSAGNCNNWTVVVDAVDEKGMSVTRLEEVGRRPGKQFVLVPLDLHAKGKTVEDAFASFSYRWQDVKKGDTIRADVAFDDGEQHWYCLAICIDRRPGGELPQSQDPKGDGKRYAKSSLLNDIDNGLDVSDDDIARLFPPKYDRDPKTGEVTLEDPGGMWGDYPKKLDGIRAKKKEKELKATPPEKKK